MTTGVFDSITKIINSPPGQLVAGGVLAGIVWKFFERVEAVLTDQTKLEIAVWLFGVKVGQKVEPWPATFAKVFDRVFGTKHLSWKCFWRSALASLLALFVTALITYAARNDAINIKDGFTLLNICLLAVIFDIGPGYLSLLQGRTGLRLMIERKYQNPCVLISNLVITAAIASVPLAFSMGFNQQLLSGTDLDYRKEFGVILDPGVLHLSIVPVLRNFGGYFLDGIYSPLASLWFYPIFFTSVWLWLYAGSGFLLKAARRFDLGFDWFKRKFDIEKKPLQSIGLVAGALVAVVYWTAVIVSRAVG